MVVEVVKVVVVVVVVVEVVVVVLVVVVVVVVVVFVVVVVHVRGFSSSPLLQSSVPSFIQSRFMQSQVLSGVHGQSHQPSEHVF